MTCAWHTENQSNYQYLLAKQSKPTITSCVEPAMCEEPCIGKLKGISHRQDCTGKQCPWIAIRLPALLVEGIPQAPMNAEFHSAAARSVNAFNDCHHSDSYDLQISLMVVCFVISVELPPVIHLVWRERFSHIRSRQTPLPPLRPHRLSAHHRYTGNDRLLQGIPSDCTR